MQDVLGLGSAARMNVPGREGGNWTWRFRWEQLTPAIEQRLADLTRASSRA
jgi:4-alpha-glucanotransferase